MCVWGFNNDQYTKTFVNVKKHIGDQVRQGTGSLQKFPHYKEVFKVLTPVIDISVHCFMLI